METATADPLVGHALEGRYRIVARLARGGMSTVYAAVDERLDRRVAVKVMSSRLSADPAFVDRFAREARVAARLSHVNAVSVYDQGHDAGKVFLVMELVTGRTLRDLLDERGHLSPAEAVSIMEPVLAALAAAHRAGLVHRDVKPENILLADDGLVKVADFGLARALDSDVASTRTGLMMGTVAYCAPEQIAKGQADQRSDVYAAGIVLFELLTGRPPYSGESAMNVAYQHVHSRVPAPSSQIRGIPNEIDELVISATDPEPSQRPSDAGAFLAEIAEIRTDLNLPITPIPQRSRAARAETPPTVRPMATDTSRTAFIDGSGFDGSGRTDTQVVPRHAAGPSGPGGPPPPIVTPPPGGKGGKGKRPPLTARQKRRRRTIIGIVALVVLGIGSAVGGISAVNWYQDWNTHVPKLAGDSLAQATQALKNDGYKLGTTTYSYDSSVKPGEIISTTPSSGSRLQKGKSVSLVVSRGVHMVGVPSVVGMSPGDAETRLSQLGFKFGPSPAMENSTTVKKGLVTRTNPPASTSVQFGASVTIFVSNGPPMVTVPTLTINESFQDFSDALTAAKFVVDRQPDAFSDTVPVGDVIPDGLPTGQLPQGSTVKVTVSKGPNVVTIPDIPAGTPLDQARMRLQQLGFVVQAQKAFGGHLKQVVGLNPPAGTSVPYGSTIVITYV